jgi:hypothetical protein
VHRHQHVHRDAAALVPIAGALSDPVLYEDVLRAWSMEGFQGTLLEAHQHFFDTFGKFGAVLTEAGPMTRSPTCSPSQRGTISSTSSSCRA